MDLGQVHTEKSKYFDWSHVCIPAAYSILERSFVLGLVYLIFGTRPFSPAKGYRSGFVSGKGPVFVRIPGKDIMSFDNKH